MTIKFDLREAASVAAALAIEQSIATVPHCRDFIGTKNFSERYYTEKAGWLKVSARGLTFPMTAEQVP